MPKEDNLTMPQKLEKQQGESVEQVENIEIIQSSTIPEFKANSSFWPSYISALSVIFALLGVLYGGLWLMRKFGYGAAVTNSSTFSRNNLRVEAQLPLGNKRQIYLLRYMNKRLLLGATDTSISLLSEEYILQDENIDPKNFDETIQNIANPNLCQNDSQNSPEIPDNILRKLFKSFKA